MPFRYTQTVVPGEAVVVFLTCSTNISSQFIGFALAQTDLALDQSCTPIAASLGEADEKSIYRLGCDSSPAPLDEFVSGYIMKL